MQPNISFQRIFLVVAAPAVMFHNQVTMEIFCQNISTSEILLQSLKDCKDDRTISLQSKGRCHDDPFGKGEIRLSQ